MRARGAAAVAAALLVAGCSGGGSGSDSSGGGEARDVVTNFLEAVRNGQGARACTFVDTSKRFELEGPKPCAEQVQTLAVPDGSTIVAASENGNSARVNMKAPNGDRYAYDLRREGGALKIDNRVGP